MNPSDLKKGKAITFKGDPYMVTEANFVFPGKGQAFVRTKMKNLRTGNALENVFKTSENIVEADVVYKRATFLYSDEDSYYFMDPETFDQQPVPVATIGDRSLFMKEDTEVKGVYLDDHIFDVELQPKMVFEVIEAPPGIKGDSSTNVTKKIKIETGGMVDVPLFIKEGEKIKISTETGEYVERVNE